MLLDATVLFDTTVLPDSVLREHAIGGRWIGSVAIIETNTYPLNGSRGT